MKAIAIAVVLGIAFLSAGCDNQPNFTPAEAIKLAKAAAYQIPSPPSIYYIVRPLVGTGGYISYWPDEPSVKATSFAVTRIDDHTPITYTTEVSLSNGGYDVTFKSEWGEGTTKTHSWLFHVGADRNATFVREEGDTLPAAPEGG